MFLNADHLEASEFSVLDTVKNRVAINVVAADFSMANVGEPQRQRVGIAQSD